MRRRGFSGKSLRVRRVSEGMPPFKRRSLKELRVMGVMLSNRISRLKREIEELEEKKRRIFKEGIGSSMLKKRMLASEIVSIEVRQRIKLRDLKAAQVRYALIKSYLSLKDHQSLRKELEKVDKLLGSEKVGERLERELARSLVKEDKVGEELDTISRIVEEETPESEAERRIIEAWSRVEAGLMSPEEAERTIALKELKEDEGKG